MEQRFELVSDFEPTGDQPAAIDRLYREWDGDDAVAMQADLDKIRSAVADYPMIPALKATVAAFSGDDSWRAVRPPLVPLSDDELSKLTATLRKKRFEMPGLS
jgi:4-hydroxy-tetrahydrodipicolinate synthase